MTFARAALLAALVAVPSTGVAQRSSVIPTGQSASPTLTPGIKVGDVIYASGQLGVSRDAPDSTIQGQTKKALEQDPDVKSVSYNYVREASWVPNDTHYGSKWALPSINAPGAWDIERGSRDIKIAILDSGISPSGVVPYRL